MGKLRLNLNSQTSMKAVKFGLGQETAGGVFPKLEVSGSVFATINDLRMHVTRGQPGGLMTAYFGTRAQSQAGLGGTLLIRASGRLSTHLLDTNGASSFEAPITPEMVGTSRAYQVLYRDTTSVSGFGVTSAIWLEFSD